ncbi:YqaE/Pmp3 family membrane protein [Segetibacter sp. 3557_3]|uniref:YqaE/Pmp3 family membrane protein n=1 Tax=Segetibacter sp. 3557_3 TaxID=2547429 RepID=UPI001A9F7B37|nr:YqaE/Pmp3 family membrane protein [Segetibacter sp. 3557_3]
MKKNLFILLLSCMVAGQGYSAFVTEPKAETEEVSVNPNAETNVPAMDAVKSAMKDFKALSRHERKEKISEAKKQIKAFKEQKKAGAEPNTNTLLLVLIALFIPPLAVYLHEGVINNRFWISLILTLLGGLPGIIYSLIVVLGPPKGDS